MKKLLMSLSLIFIISACGSTDTANNSESDKVESASDQRTIESSEATDEEVNDAPSDDLASDDISEEKEEGIEQPQTPTINLGEVVVIEDFAEIKVIKNVFAKRIDPPNPGSFFSYYENMETDEIYLDTVISVKSLLTSARFADEFVDVKIIYDNKYEYMTFSTIEENGGSDFTYTNITSIEPLKTGVLHFIASVPAEIENDGKPLKAIITVNGEEFEQIIR